MDFGNLKENENRIKNRRTVLGFNSARGLTTRHDLQPNLAHAAQAVGRARAITVPWPPTMRRLLSGEVMSTSSGEVWATSRARIGESGLTEALQHR
jgi:hypothetical protein